MPRRRPTHLRPLIRSPRKMAAIGTVHRLVVQTTTDDLPGGTNWSAEKTKTKTVARRNTANEIITGRSAIGGNASLPLETPIVITTTAAPSTLNTPIQIGEIDAIPVAMTGQLSPNTRTTVTKRA
jgi:hypothetical protein